MLFIFNKKVVILIMDKIMWLYFDDTGALIKSLEHGPAARVGATAFQIFAYFKDIDLSTYNTATIKFIRDDYNTSSHPMLFMNLTRNAPFVINDANDETEQNVYPFVPGHKYTGFLFDFANFGVDQDVAILLDTPGKWHAVITLYAGAIQYVQGTVEFYVEGPILETDPYIASLDDVVGNVAKEMSSRKIEFIPINALEGNLSEENLEKLTNSDLNRIVFNNIIYYYARINDNIKIYYAITEQVGGITDYNEIDVDLETGHYVVTSVYNKRMMDHINDRVVHITQQEREFWNNKVTTDVGSIEELILTKN